jgi:CheY-like chemotaxis protein
MKSGAFHILLAEDDPSISAIVETILKRRGHSVDVTHTGKEAIKRFSEHPGAYDVLLTDHSMPEATGLELVSYMRKNGFEGKIIVMSGSLTDDLIKAYRTKRINKILQKPFSQDVLDYMLTELFQHLDEKEN